ncbi:tetratricopeptide repeat protein [Fimbriiglobus ruber]|nr:tetratricopeptide repeat protein [Fimbriiglobus ruber]
MRFAEAEAVTRQGFEALVAASCPDDWRSSVRYRLRQTAGTLAGLAEATGKPDEARKWRAEAAKYVDHQARGRALYEQGDPDGAVAAFRTAVQFDPKATNARINLGLALQKIGSWDEAMAVYRAAARLDPKNASAPLRIALVSINIQNDYAAALPFAQKAVELAPKDAQAHSSLGLARLGVGDERGAVAAYEEACGLNPNDAAAKNGLARSRLLPRLPGVLAGIDRPATPAEAAQFAWLFGLPSHKRYLAAARLYEKSFVNDPKQNTADRYNAACCAVRAARGDGGDAPPDPAERAAWRAKALAWLRANLVVREKKAALPSRADRQASADRLVEWLGDAKLSGVRPGLARIAMTPAERADWDALWAEVRATISAARQPPSTPDTAPPPRRK